MPHFWRLRPVEVHRLRAAQLDVPRNEEGSRGLVVPLALPPLPQEHHGVGGQALHHVGYQRDHFAAELHPMVRGHQEVAPGLGVQAFQGATQLNWWGRGVSAVGGVRPGDAAVLLLTRRRP